MRQKLVIILAIDFLFIEKISGKNKFTVKNDCTHSMFALIFKIFRKKTCCMMQKQTSPENDKKKQS
jgi:hypothetical protein